MYAMDGVRLVTLFSYFSVCIWIGGKSKYSTTAINILDKLTAGFRSVILNRN